MTNHRLKGTFTNNFFKNLSIGLLIEFTRTSEV